MRHIAGQQRNIMASSTSLNSSQRSRSNVVAFPTWFAPVFQSQKRKKVAA